MKQPDTLSSVKPTLPEEYIQNHTWIRLDDQIHWYDKKSQRSQMCYKIQKILQLICAALIPIVNILPISFGKIASVILGAMIALLEGFQQLFQYSTNWFIYRSTAENLKHIKYLFLAKSGTFNIQDNDERFKLLAEYIEEIVSAEHSHWIANKKHLNDSSHARK